ncbi:MAG: AAA family ATPase [Clostridia bacterium]|nr:AAA family ATPase [Clostridia bacterium]
MDFELTADQERAASLIKHWFLKESGKLFVLAGYAGTGKTTLIRHVVCDVLGLIPGKSAAFVTPTGKAATVLIQGGTIATTLHHLIYQARLEEKEVEVRGEKVTVEKLVFTKRDTIDSSIKLIVLDEASMVTDQTLYDLASYNIKILMCGDNAQLPPIEGTGTRLKHADCTLETIVRQEKDNPIIYLSELARKGERIMPGNYGDRAFVLKRSTLDPRRQRKYMLSADQLICGLNRTRQKINEEMRIYTGHTSLPEDGDKLICVNNNWEEYIDEGEVFNLVNGIIGTARNIEYDMDQGIGFMEFSPDFLDTPCPYTIPFDASFFVTGTPRGKDEYFLSPVAKNLRGKSAFKLNQFEFGYCVSCHKAQGSEFDKVVVFDESYAFKENRTNWLYTAITRAKNKLIILV